MSTEFTGGMKVSLEITRLSTKAGRTEIGGSKRSESKIITSRPQNGKTENPAPTRNIQGKHLRKELYRRG